MFKDVDSSGGLDDATANTEACHERVRNEDSEGWYTCSGYIRSWHYTP